MKSYFDIFILLFILLELFLVMQLWATHIRFELKQDMIGLEEAPKFVC